MESCEESISSRWTKAVREMGDRGGEGGRGELAGGNAKFTGEASANAETNWHIGAKGSFASQIANQRET